MHVNASACGVVLLLLFCYGLCTCISFTCNNCSSDKF